MAGYLIIHPSVMILAHLMLRSKMGHIAGDRVLKNVGDILRKSLRKTDSAYRYGGEEFAVILPESEGDEALHFADRIRQAFESPASRAQPEENTGVTVSIGVAQYIKREDTTAFIKRADKNMYTAKNSRSPNP
jgi:diguanylate cyclase (GGDEF)-like protein